MQLTVLTQHFTHVDTNWAAPRTTAWGRSLCLRTFSFFSAAAAAAAPGQNMGGAGMKGKAASATR
eukprot:1148755-Pelagomonas_calceolata.AAC.2